ncbi:hypothetical protein MCOR27_001098 [Pyricularia oryzae]|uniref:GH64 domain-containing protein n=4 Tax=Pyricularia TaxID=48558 RepID=A0ABQ8NIZ3_PYRGI|nr:glucanase B [Pyricularia oryzae 70-15]ELQ42660.1 glucanase B [Pyricularia oryzae Y34]KAH8841080.1 hypothetical protein MCOR01_007750 [Pyricularia oryzae]KAI6297856.1 hypothetical protein MCOR33_005859 [Pyricularia grisea]EHA49120.1 glucanase B [Pyricularia oryzae 70-15]KAI6257539.1 hypothetical protein MCOR19_006076 [Pyricularia oryzae]
MATLQQVLQHQQEHGILMAPTEPPQETGNTVEIQATPQSMPFALRNNTTSSTVYAYVTGLDFSNNNSRVVLVQSDGKSLYYPTSPAADLQPLLANCAIPLGAPGTTTTVTVPRMSGGRVWFVQDATLTFLLNRGLGSSAALVEPSIMNPADPNYQLNWSFCEFTLNDVELFANISYVDFVNHPIALVLESNSRGPQRVEGMPADGLATVAQKLTEQNGRDGAGWDRLLIRQIGSGKLLRAVSPNTGMNLFSGLFATYYDGYVNQVWQKYSGTDLTVNTQFTWGVVKGRVANGLLAFGSVGSFGQPSTRDIFSSDSGAFAPPAGDNQEQLRNIAARLAAAFNRSTLLINANQPDGEQISTYYTNTVTNHYSRILHEVNIDKRGYAFPYDDVVPSGGGDQAGTVNDGNPKVLTIVLGGGNTSTAAE